MYSVINQYLIRSYSPFPYPNRRKEKKQNKEVKEVSKECFRTFLAQTK